MRDRQASNRAGRHTSLTSIPRRLAKLLAFAGLFIGPAVVVAAAIAFGLGYRPMLVATDSVAVANSTPGADTSSSGSIAASGSLAIVGPRPAETIVVGDVLIVESADGTAVPRRVIEIERSPSGQPVAITSDHRRGSVGSGLEVLDGDLNAIRWVVPALGRLIVTMADPMAAFSFTVILLVGMVWILRRLWSSTTPTRLSPSCADHPESASTGPATAPTAATGRRSLGAKGAVAVLAANGLLSAGVASALFTGSDAVANNQFGTGCFDASVARVQTGQATNSVEGTQTISLATAVDPTRSLLLTSLASDSAEPADSMVLARLTGPTQIELLRNTDAAGPPNVIVGWTVVEYGCGVTVQRGDLPGNGGSDLDIPIATADQADSFVVTSAVPDRADTAFDGDDTHLATLTSSTNLRLAAPATGSLPTDHRYGWQVVTFDDPGDVSVQTATQTLSATNSETVTLATAVDPETTLILARGAGVGTGSDIGERRVRAHLSSPTTVELTRLVGGEAIEVQVQVIEFTEGTTVQHGIVNLGVGQDTAAVTVDPLDSSTASALATVAGPGSGSGGATDMVASAVVGESSATFEVTDPTTVTITRSTSTSTASFGWQLIQWGGPGWWDTDSPFRQRIDVATGAVSAPDGYTVPLAIDHASLVTAGFATASGDDLRVLRWNGSGWTELHRVLDDDSTWNAVDTTVWFTTEAAIDSSSTDSYWLYFGDDTPAAPLDDPEQVWLLFETFDSGSLGDFADRTGGINWYQAEPWSHRIPLTIQASQVDADLTSFPVLVSLVDTALGAGAQADGDDIRFTAADGVTPLSHEVEHWDPGTGELQAWVLVPTVSAGADTDIYLYYGAAQAPDHQDPPAVWTDAEAVWHLHRDPSGPAPQLDDSSPARRDGLSTGAMSGADLVTGQVGQAVDFDGVDDRLTAQPFDLSTNALTASGWVNLDSTAGDQLIVGKADAATGGIVTLGTTGTQARFQLSVAGVTHSVTGGTLGVGAWHHLAATWDGTTMTLYVDGFVVDSATPVGRLDGDDPSSNPLTVGIGDLPSNQWPLDGRLDEVRLESVARSQAWIRASERNQSGPGSFVSAAATQTGTWFDQGTWNHRKPLTVDGSFVASTLSGQPVLVDVTDAELVGKLQADGDDVVFTAADGITRLHHVLDEVNAASGTVTAWVRVPTLAAGTDTELFLYYGNSTAVSQHSSEQVFGPDADVVVTGP